jgi:hypothetical protein
MHMAKPKLLDLFTGTGSVSRAAEELGYDVRTLDIDAKCHPDICADILDFAYRDAFTPGEFDVVWSSPPCQTFSCARWTNVGRNDYTAESLARDMLEIGVPILRRTQEIIAYLQPRVWFIENPYTGRMKNFIPEPPAVFDYCMFGFSYRKRTAIWSNAALQSRLCDGSHKVDGRHPMTAIGSSKTQAGQGGGTSTKGRYAIPKDLVVQLLGRAMQT